MASGGVCAAAVSLGRDGPRIPYLAGIRRRDIVPAVRLRQPSGPSDGAPGYVVVQRYQIVRRVSRLFLGIQRKSLDLSAKRREDRVPRPRLDRLRNHLHDPPGVTHEHVIVREAL